MRLSRYALLLGLAVLSVGAWLGECWAQASLKHRLLATSMFKLFAEVGGTLAYGPDIVLVSERGAVLIAKILGGAKPAELPVERPTKVQLVVNLKSAKVLGITIPQSILLRADEVIR